MIQRIQSVYLLFAALIVALVGFFPWAHCYTGAEGAGGFYTISALGVSANGVEDFSGSSVWCWLASLSAFAAVVLILWSLFGFKNRVRQMQLCISSILVLIVFYLCLGAELWAVREVTGEFPNPDLVGQCPLIAIILLFLAGRAIKRDEDLVRSMDRIR